MIRKSLFNENGNYSKEADDLEDLIREPINEAFREYIARGYSIRDISHVIRNFVHTEESYYSIINCTTRLPMEDFYNEQ